MRRARLELPIVDLKKEPMSISVVERGKQVSFSDMPEPILPILIDAFGARAIDMVTGVSPAQHAFNMDLASATRVKPRYLELAASGELERRVRVLREAGRLDKKAEYFMVAINRSDEQILGRTGVLYLVCRKGCHFCQYRNFASKTIDAEGIAARMLALQAQGADNIQWLSPTQYVPLLLEALALAVRAGLKIPIVHKSEGEDPLDDLELLDGVVDVYLPDIKFIHPDFADKIGLPASYPARMKLAIREMYRQVGILKRKTDRGRVLAGGGLLVRHLLMPGGADEAKAVLDFIYAIDPDLPAHVMTGYEPLHEGKNIPGIDRRTTEEEINAVVVHSQTVTRNMHVLFG